MLAQEVINLSFGRPALIRIDHHLMMSYAQIYIVLKT